MKIRIDAISSEGIDQYNMLRIGPDGEHLPINGIDWQDSNVFSGMPVGGGYILQAKDIKGNIAEKVVPIEDDLSITSYGGYIKDGAIYVSCATTIDSQMRIKWGIPDEEGHVEQEDLGWTDGFSTAHQRPLPVFYMNAEHHYWLSVRSRHNQRYTVNGRYIITPGTIEITEYPELDPPKTKTFEFDKASVIVMPLTISMKSHESAEFSELQQPSLHYKDALPFDRKKVEPSGMYGSFSYTIE